MKCSSQRGVALVVTLIMLTVITVIAVAFLAVTHRERSAVKQKAKSTDAEYAANAGLERAKAQILAYFDPTPDRSNAVGPDLFVSRDYINPLGFNPANGANITNVSYWYGNPNSIPPPAGVNPDDALRNLGNLLLDPRPPVFIDTNRPGQTGPRDFRYFLDLNRNGRFEDTGFLPVVAADGQFFRDANGIIVTNYFTGDPQWIGILEYPNRPHWTDNYFIGRYAYLVVPIGRTLDLNWIHNYALGSSIQLATPPNMSAPYSSSLINYYLRNQGAGTWEQNLAAVLADLNPNIWNDTNSGAPYSYQPLNANGTINLVNSSSGYAFEDARELLRYRYTPLSLGYPPPQSPHLYLDQVSQTLPNEYDPPRNPPHWFTNDLIDALCNGPITPLGRALLPTEDRDDRWNLPWPGSDGQRHFYTIHDLFDPAKMSAFPDFTAHLQAASARVNTYDRTTFYRLLSVLGTDSVPESDGKININYKDIEGVSATNFVSWDALQFFTHVADQLLKEEYGYTSGIGVFNIPIFTNGLSRLRMNVTNAYGVTIASNTPLYSPRVHQLLQLAANIYEATIGAKTNEAEPYYPTVFRPQFKQTGANIYISGFTELDHLPFIGSLASANMRFYDLDDPLDRASSNYGNQDMFYGIPLIIGAKKGFPNFNEFAAQSVAQFSRRLLLTKATPTDVRPNETNQLYIIGVSNFFGVEAWNSYTSAYPRPLQLVFTNRMETTLTNDTGFSTNSVLAMGTNMLFPSNTWVGGAYQVPVYGVTSSLPASVFYLRPTPHLEPVAFSNSFERVAIYTNRWGLSITNRMAFALFDRRHNRVVDFASFGNLGWYFDVSGELTKSDGPSAIHNQWSIQPRGNINEGVNNQIQVSLGADRDNPKWANYGGLDPVVGNIKGKAIDGFRVFMGIDSNDLPRTNIAMQAPYTARKTMYQAFTWNVNDPLVHYTAEDLVDEDAELEKSEYFVIRDQWLGKPNPRHRPWGGRDSSTAIQNDMNVLIKDPNVYKSDDWDFPAQKLPNIGWLGRVHRGTPWQTIYLKSMAASASDWLTPEGPGRSLDTHPTVDWRLVDIFTVAQHPNATRGQLSINQTNVAAWSAVLSGVPVTTLQDVPDNPPDRVDYFVEPAAKHPALLTIVQGINQQRAKMPGQQFQKLSEFMSVPELTSATPFLNEPFLTQALAAQVGTANSPLMDSDYERIPQQILSLVKVGGEARYAVYAFGQSLRPARNSIYTGTGPYHGLCQNYEITGEVATRAIVRVDFDRELINGQPVGPPIYTRPHAVVESFNILPTD